MCSFRFTISRHYRKELEKQLRSAQQLGQLARVKYLLAILAVMDDQPAEQVAQCLRIHGKTLVEWVRLFCVYGVKGAPRKTPTGRPPKLSATQKEELAQLIEAGPQAAGFSAGCWRSPLVQELILRRFGRYYSVFYLAQLLKNLGFSWQKAAFVSAHLDADKRREWCRYTWPKAVRLARQQNALLLFGDEASFPQWGTLSYTWSRKGQQLQVPTSGVRKGYKVLGLLDYFTGRFFYQGQHGRLDTAAYVAFLTRVLAQTTERLVLIQDGARYHTSKAAQAFFAAHAARLTVFQLPSYSPDYNPIEKLWKQLKQADTHMQYFPTFAALTTKVEQALLKFAQAPATILSLCGLPRELAVLA
jgi:transposase